MLQRGMCESLGCRHHPMMGTAAWWSGVAAFAKAPLGEALILHVGTKGRDLQVAAMAPVQALPSRQRDVYSHVVGSCCLSLLNGSSPSFGFPKTGSTSSDLDLDRSPVPPQAPADPQPDFQEHDSPERQAELNSAPQLNLGRSRIFCLFTWTCPKYSASDGRVLAELDAYRWTQEKSGLAFAAHALFRQLDSGCIWDHSQRILSFFPERGVQVLGHCLRGN